MQKRHKNKWQYFNEQAQTTQKYVIPYIEQHLQLSTDTTVLEIGCGEGGNLLPFVDMGCKVTGIDLSKGKIDKGNEFYQSHKNLSKLTLIADNIYNRNDLGKFDLIILRDVIEHIPDQNFFMEYFKCFFHAKSIVFFGFPPWQNPFGGHQQICNSRILSKMPYFHMLPVPVYKGVLKLFGEPQSKIKGLLEIKKTGISIERFESITKTNNYNTLNKTLFFINPNYEVKFKLQPRKQSKFVASIPWFRNFFTTCAYYLLNKNNLD
ncbi:class I SAM-dependent methyltransferase [Draconibacterium sp. IB214405]|uniref:class I SAM-dependent methyltransferase n=1 Tax=Draconibacterium sp. IB214405 TaxID=3097352 RepID=UPI002A1042A1|nr:class I SAM-dependent methyltransferase [Draconibacterium sp. IB214405]MDX8338067.1 class I SAM-dependent methyltransferase [Draconibacterium sp. IB214405]